MRQPQPSGNFYSLIFIYISGITTIGLFTTRDQSLVVSLAYFATFFSYFWLANTHRESNYLFGLGLIARLILFLGMPSLSDDIYRFIWDGNLLTNGINPYLQTPNATIREDAQIQGITKQLFDLLNSKDYFSVYPPFNQFLFWLSVKFGGDSWLAVTNILRVILLAGEVGSFFLLKRIFTTLKKPKQLAHWYWLNPLVILEIIGNIHFEGLVIFFVLLSIWLLQRDQLAYSGVALGMAIGTKLLPLIFLPALLFKLKWNKGLLMVITCMFVVIIALSPILINGGTSGIQSSLRLYFQHFEFNASIYYLIREIGFVIKGYNVIAQLGPVLSVITFSFIMTLSYFGSKNNWPTYRIWLFSLLIYLTFSTTIHPWYVLLLVPLGLLSGHYFPVAWSLFVFITYWGYNQEGYELSPFWLVFEYACLWIFIGVEIYLKNKNEKVNLS